MNRKNFLKTGLIGTILGFIAPNYVNAIDKKLESKNFTPVIFEDKTKVEPEPIRPIVHKIVEMLKNQPEKWEWDGNLANYLTLKNNDIYITIMVYHSFLGEFSSFTFSFKDSFFTLNSNEDKYIEPYFEKIVKPLRDDFNKLEKTRQENNLKNDIQTILNY